MNTETFLYIHAINSTRNINKDARININYDTFYPDPESSPMGRITGFTVTVKTKKDWNLPLSTANEVNLENVLLTATTVRFVVDNQIFNLPITNRAKYNNSFNNSNSNYYYFTVTPTDFELTTNAQEQNFQTQQPNITDVAFLPHVQTEKYEYSDFNPLISNALENRKSIYTQQSDRVGSNTNPTNLRELVQETATPAQIQDSNYTSTGWSNARYIGSATDAQTYKGIPPAITARTFQGEVNPSSSVDLLICSRSFQDRIVTDLLFTGEQEVPSFEGFVNTQYELQENAPEGITVIPITGSGVVGTVPVEIGSILAVEDFNEKLRVTNIKQGVGTVPTTLTVVRGYLDTAVEDLTQGKKLYIVKPLRIFKIDNVSAKIVNSSNSRIWVKDSKEILYTDEYGIVHASSSLCIT